MIFSIDMAHPWASSPRTIGSLAIMYLCTFFIKNHDESIGDDVHDDT